MSAAYSNTDAQPDHVEFDIRNDSQETWRAADGFGIGYQLFDADTGTLIVDGPRVHPERDVKPGETAHVRLDLEPPENGRITPSCRRCGSTSAGTGSKAGRFC